MQMLELSRKNYKIFLFSSTWQTKQENIKQLFQLKPAGPKIPGNCRNGTNLLI